MENTQENTQAIHEGGEKTNPIFGCLGFAVVMVVIGVRHSLDLGVKAEVLGNIMWEYLKFLGGRSSMKAKVNILWLKLKHWYRTQGPPSQLHGLTKEMIRREKKHQS
jgi:hypothetical protein